MNFEDYRREKPGLSRRLMYSRQLKNRNVGYERLSGVVGTLIEIHSEPQINPLTPDLSYEFLSTLVPVTISVSPLRLEQNSKTDINKYTDDFCNICQENIKLFEIILTLNCDHIYHKICIQTHCLSSNKCPTCRNLI
jgi:hypothetical protein